MGITIKDIIKLKKDITNCDLIIEEYDTGNESGYDCRQVNNILNYFINKQSIKMEKIM